MNRSDTNIEVFLSQTHPYLSPDQIPLNEKVQS